MNVPSPSIGCKVVSGQNHLLTQAGKVPSLPLDGSCASWARRGAGVEPQELGE